MPQAENHHLGHDGATVPEAFYVRREEDRLTSTLHAQGAWQPGEQHLAPASGLLVAEVERRLPSDKRIVRASFDVLGVIHSGDFVVEVESVRPGRTIELVEARMRHGDRVSVQARVWRLAGSDTRGVEGHEFAMMPPPGEVPAFPFAAHWGGGFIAALEARQTEDSRPGRGRSWVRTPYPLVAGETDPATAAFAKLVDTSNGLAVREDPRRVFFPNVDLGIHLFRTPVPGWVGLDTRVNFGPGGLGETFSVLHDEKGPVGTCTQALTVRLGRGASH